jgi:hypothetical protein
VGEKVFKVPAFVLTGGRVRSGVELAIETLVKSTTLGRTAAPRLALERQRIALMALDPLSVAEISAHLSVPLGVARVLVGDMIEEGLLDAHQLDAKKDQHLDVSILERVLVGLEAL